MENKFETKETDNKKEYEAAIKYLKNIGVKLSFTSCPTNPNFEGSKDKFNFFIELKKKKVAHDFYFSQSNKTPFVIRRRPLHNFEEMKRKLLRENRFPNVWGFLTCLCLDSACLNYCFQDWCDNLGYDSDSIKAENIYRSCIEQSRKVESLFCIYEVSEYLDANELN